MPNKIVFYLNEVENLLNKKLQLPVCAEIDPSNICNNECHFCCFKRFLNDNPVNLSFIMFRLFMDDFAKNGGKAVTFTGGGEPLMNPYFADMAKHCIDRGVKIGLVTNGTMLHRLQGLWHMFEFIRVSINAPNREIYKQIHGADNFDVVINNVKKVLTYFNRPAVGLSVVSCAENKDHIDECVKLGDELGVDYVQVKPDIYNFERGKVEGESKGRKIVSPLYPAKQYHETACAVAGLTFILNATGSVYYCCVHRGNPDFKLGSIHDYTLKELVDIRRDFKPDISQCHTCRYSNYAKAYEKYKAEKYIFLRHKEFL